MTFRTIGLVTLGCSKNLTDSEYLVSKLTKAGYKVVRETDQTDALLINTCGFIDDAKKESIESILASVQLKASKKTQKIIVTGCLVERYLTDLKKDLPEVDDFIQIKDYPAIGERLNRVFGSDVIPEIHKDRTLLYDEYDERTLLTPGYYAYLKIADGCNHTCGFCMIPLMRGRFVSRNPDDLVKEAESLADRGVKELIIIAQDVTFYGRDLKERTNLAQLLRKICRVSKLEWIRLLYLYPTTMTDEMIDVMAEEEKICKYIDMPFQHASDRILERMRRGYNRKRMTDIVDNIRRRMPDAALRTTLIVGYPGETEEDMDTLEDFLETTCFDRVGVFRYSDEEGSYAFELDGKVSTREKNERYHRIMKLQRTISENRLKRWVGRDLKILIDEVKDNGLDVTARTEYDAPEVDGTVILSGQGFIPGQFVNARITDALEYDLVGEVK